MVRKVLTCSAACRQQFAPKNKRKAARFEIGPLWSFQNRCSVLFGVGKALVDKERIAIGALDFAALVRERKIDTGMAKSTLTTVASDPQ